MSEVVVEINGQERERERVAGEGEEARQYVAVDRVDALAVAAMGYRVWLARPELRQRFAHLPEGTRA